MNAKKILLSLGFVFVLGIYIVYQKSASGNNNPILNNNNPVSTLPAANQNQSKASGTETIAPAKISKMDGICGLRPKAVKKNIPIKANTPKTSESVSGIILCFKS